MENGRSVGTNEVEKARNSESVGTKRDITIEIRINAAEKEMIKQFAGNMSMSEYIRKQILPECRDTSKDTYAEEAAKRGRVINLSEIPEGTRLPPGSLGKYDTIVSY